MVSVRGEEYVSLIVCHKLNWNESWICSNLFENCVIYKEINWKQFYLCRMVESASYISLKRKPFIYIWKDEYFLLQNLTTFWKYLLKKNAMKFWKNRFGKNYLLIF